MDTDAKEGLRRYALDVLGFDACGFAPPRDLEAVARTRTWLERGFHGEMAYLERHLPLKENPERLLPGVRAAVVVAASYRNTRVQHLTQRWKIARYAVGRDYHRELRPRLRDLEAHLAALLPGSRCYAGVDSRPIDERALALLGGIGFRGRNTLVIRPGLGSYFFLGVLLTTADLAPDAPVAVSCGTCTRCVDACPTQALDPAGVLDARRCISYRTIEQVSPLTPEQQNELHGWVFGCDICQEVCPFNARRDLPLTRWDAFRPEAGVGFEAMDRLARGAPAPAPRASALHRTRHRLRNLVRSLLA